MEITEKEYAEGLLKTLESKYPCTAMNCPAYKIDSDCDWGCHDNICEMCREFVNVTDDTCPCYFYGKETAITTAWLKLEEKGYLE